MREETHFSLLKIKDNPEYDAAIKEFFKNREVIAPILKATIEEYKDCTIEEIIKYIDADSIDDKTPVSDLPPLVGNENTEHSSVYEKTIFFDMKFKALNPKLSNEKIIINLHIDFEVQNDYKPSNPKYPIIKRAIYYPARDISEQLGVITQKTNYADLEKSYSIWVCNGNISKKLQNTISSYKIVRTDIVGKCDEPKEDYDLMEAVIVRRGDKAAEDNDLMQYLEGVFTSDLDRIKKYVDVPEGSKIESEVTRMSGLAAEVFDKGYDTGYDSGYDTGYDTGYDSGEGRLGTLISWLFFQQRPEDARKAAEDAVARKDLYKEYDETMKKQSE